MDFKKKMNRLAVPPPKTETFETRIVTSHADTFQWNGLALAAASGRTETVRDCLQKQKQEQEQSDSNNTFVADCVYFGWKAFQNPNALILAAGHGHYECVELLKGTELHTRTLETKQTALMAAAAACYPDIVRLLLDQAGNKDWHGWTALMYAADRGSPDCCKFLVGIEAGQKDENFQCALLLAAIGGHLDAVRVIAPSEAKEFGAFIINIIEDGPIKDVILKCMD